MDPNPIFYKTVMVKEYACGVMCDLSSPIWDSVLHFQENYNMVRDKYV